MSEWNHMHGPEELDRAPDAPGIPSVRPRASVTRRALITAAVLAIPVGAAAVYKHLESTTAKQGRDLEAAFALDTARHRNVSPSLVTHREADRFDVGFDGARVIALGPAGELLAVGNKELRRLSAAGALQNRTLLPERAWAVAQGPDGGIYVAFKDRIETYSAKGDCIASWKSFGGKAHLTSIVATSDALWIADAGRRIVLRCNLDGDVVAEFASADASRSIPGLVVPSANLDLALAPDGHVWVANPGLHRLESYSRDGQLERFWGSPGAGVESFFGCCNPADFAILPDGSFITAEKQVARIKHYHADGRLLGVVADPKSLGEAQSGIEVAVTAKGDVIALERGTRTVRIYTPIDARKEATDVANVD